LSFSSISIETRAAHPPLFLQDLPDIVPEEIVRMDIKGVQVTPFSMSMSETW